MLFVTRRDVVSENTTRTSAGRMEIGNPYRWSNDGAKNKNAAAEMVRKYVFLTRGSTWHKAQSLLSVLVVNLQE